MLVLTRRPGEEIVIGGGIRITLLGVKGGQARIGVSAPPSVTVDRREVAERRAREGWAPVLSCSCGPADGADEERARGMAAVSPAAPGD
jgi:carbon storage regulator